MKLEKRDRNRRMGDSIIYHDKLEIVKQRVKLSSFTSCLGAGREGRGRRELLYFL